MKKLLLGFFIFFGSAYNTPENKNQINVNTLQQVLNSGDLRTMLAFLLDCRAKNTRYLKKEKDTSTLIGQVKNKIPKLEEDKNASTRFILPYLSESQKKEFLAIFNNSFLPQIQNSLPNFLQKLSENMSEETCSLAESGSTCYVPSEGSNSIISIDSTTDEEII